MVVAGKKFQPKEGHRNITEVWSMGQEFEKIVPKDVRLNMGIDDFVQSRQRQKGHDMLTAAGKLKSKMNKFETEIGQRYILRHQN